MAHTPGPWTATRYWAQADTHYHAVMAKAADDGREVRVCSCLPISDDGQLGGESNCNARLIAAAPELLEACHAALGVIQYLLANDDNGTAETCMEILAEALNKAEGRTK